MKRSLFILVGGAVLCSLAFSLDSSSDFKKFMTDLLPKVKKAFESKDTKFFDKLSTADFTQKEGGKTANKKEALAGMKQMFDSAQSIKCTLKILSTSVKGDVGTATTSDHMVMIMKPAKKGDKTHTMTIDMWEKETWVKDGKGWKIKYIEEAKPAKMLMDGKPMDPSKMGG